MGGGEGSGDPHPFIHQLALGKRSRVGEGRGGVEGSSIQRQGCEGKE